MTNYTKTTNFATKDTLPSGNANKIVKGTEIDTEFNNISTAVATKADIAGPTFTGTVTIPTVDLNGGAIDGTIVGASTAAAITGTTIVANTSINIAGDGATVTGIKDEDDMSSNSATKLATQQSIKAYVDSQVTAQDLDFQADSGGVLSIDLDSETLTFTGGTGVDTSGSGNAVTFAIDSTVATLTGTQTLTNKTLTSPTLNTPTIGTSFTIGSATITEAELEILDGATVTTAELNILDGVTATTAEINYVDGVTSNVQTQLDAKAPIASPTFTGTVTVPGLTTSADILFGDNDKAIFGAGSDLQIFHNGTDSFIRDVGTGGLKIDSNGPDLTLRVNATESAIVANSNGSVDLYYDNALKLATTSTGIDVTGVITTDGMTTSADINFGDNDKAVFGAGSDLQIYHDGTHSNIKESGAGDLQIFGDNVNIYNAAGSQNLINLTSGGANTFFHNGLQKLATTSTGIDVTGTVTADDAVYIEGSSPRVQLQDTDGTIQLSFFQQAGEDLVLRLRNNTADGGFTVAGYGGASTTNRFYVQPNGNISFYEDTGTTPKMVWDSSAESLAIGLSSANARLEVGAFATTSSDIAYFSNSNGAHKGIIRLDSNGDGEFVLRDAGNNEDVLITAGGDSYFNGGNLLVGKTSSDIGTNGFEAASSGITRITRTSATANTNPALIINRKSSDGPIVDLKKDGTTVGSIGTSSADGFYIHSTFGNDSGLVFGSERIVPCTSTGAFEDDVQDLGYSSGRFKDLYLSGGVYLGGTGSANKLDDYEVGTFTPTANAYSGVMSVNEAVYRKIGDLVMVRVAVAFDGTTDGSAVILNGLPFSSNSSGSGGFVSDDGSGSATSVRYQAATSMAVTDGQNAVTYTTVGANSIKLTYFYIAT